MSCSRCAPGCGPGRGPLKGPPARWKLLPRKPGPAVAFRPGGQRQARVPACALESLAKGAGRVQGESPLILADGGLPGGRGGRRRTDRHPGRPDGRNEIETVLKLAGAAGPARHRPGPRDGDDRQAHPDLARRTGQPEQAHRRLHAGRHVRRRQDRDRAGAGRGAVRRRAEPDHHQHERVPGGAHRLDAEGRAARATWATAKAA